MRLLQLYIILTLAINTGLANTEVKHPIKPYALIKIKNEGITLKACLASILPAIDRGVIAYNDCTDNSERIILDFCKKHPKFIPFKYPHHVVPPHSPEYKNELPEKNTMASYLNAALRKLPKNQWIITVDGDEIYDAEKLKESFKLVKNTNDIIYYPKINLHIQKGKLHIVKCLNTANIANPKDHLLIFNNNLKFVMMIKNKSKGNKFRAYEHLMINRISNRKNAELLMYHFPNLKKHRSIEESEKIFGPLELVPLEKVYENPPKTQFPYEKDFINPKTVQRTLTAFGLKKLFKK